MVYHPGIAPCIAACSPVLSEPARRRGPRGRRERRSFGASVHPFIHSFDLPFFLFSSFEHGQPQQGWIAQNAREQTGRTVPE